MRGKVIIHIPEDTDSPDRLQEMLDRISPSAATQVVRSLGHLHEQIVPQADQPRPIVIILTPTKADLQRLLEIQEQFENTRLILVLSDADEEMVGLGHRMRPRFIGCLANGLAEIAAVAAKMAGESRSGRSIRERRS
jgi:hypothetical protein